MLRERPDKQPRKTDGFSYSRKQVGGVITWRLFRRDSTGRLHSSQAQLGVSANTYVAALSLKRARKWLRDHVDGIDLEATGVRS